MPAPAPAPRRRSVTDRDSFEEDEEDSDMNMAILLSIQDPRLNNLTLNRDTVASSVIDPSQLSILTSMGFTEEQSRRALESASNDVEVAIHSLLSSGLP